MPLTRANVDMLINRRCGAILREVGMHLEEEGTDNTDLHDPIAWALRRCGLSVASPVAPTEDEIAAVPSDQLDQFLDHVELRALESALTRYVGVDVGAQGESQRHDQLGMRIERAIARKREQIARDYASATVTLTGGVIGLSFQETADAS